MWSPTHESIYCLDFRSQKLIFHGKGMMKEVAEKSKCGDENYRLVSILVKNLVENFWMKLFGPPRKPLATNSAARNVQQSYSAKQNNLILIRLQFH